MLGSRGRRFGRHLVRESWESRGEVGGLEGHGRNYVEGVRGSCPYCV